MGWIAGRDRGGGGGAYTRVASTDEGARYFPARAKSQRFSGGQYGENRAATGCRKVSNLVNGERPGVRIAHAPLRRWPRCAQRDCRSAVPVDPRRPSGVPSRSPRGWPTSPSLLTGGTRRVDSGVCVFALLCFVSRDLLLRRLLFFFFSITY